MTNLEVVSPSSTLHVWLHSERLAFQPGAAVHGALLHERFFDLEINLLQFRISGKYVALESVI